jgi:hypothetical protein
VNKSEQIGASLLLGLTVMDGACAERGHVDFSNMLGANWRPWYYPSYLHAVYPPVVVMRLIPPVDLEKPAPTVVMMAPAVTVAKVAPVAGNAVGNPTLVWRYCAASRNYFPYVKKCPGGWQQLAPLLAGQS